MTDQRPNAIAIAAGLCFIALGVLLLLQMHGMMSLERIVQLWPAALVIIGAAVVIQATRGGESASRVPIGGLVWLLILGTVFTYAFARKAAIAEGRPEGSLNSFAVLSGDKQPPVHGSFHGGAITAVMGGTNLDLRGATLAPGETAVLDVFTFMGGGDVRVPADWEVQVDASSIMAGIKDTRHDAPRSDDPAGPRPRLIIRGTVVMGGITIRP